jgi:hypothetical protein
MLWSLAVSTRVGTSSAWLFCDELLGPDLVNHSHLPPRQEGAKPGSSETSPIDHGFG